MSNKRAIHRISLFHHYLQFLLFCLYNYFSIIPPVTFSALLVGGFEKEVPTSQCSVVTLCSSISYKCPLQLLGLCDGPTGVEF